MRIILLFILWCSATSPLSSESFGYVANYIGKSVSIIDVVTNVAVGYVDNNSFDISNPIQLKFSQDALKAYLVCDSVNSVFIIDPLTNKIIGKVNDTLFPFSAPSSIDITPDNLTAYVTNELNNTVSIIDVATDTVTGVVNVGIFPFNLPISVTIDPVGVKAYVTNLHGNNVSVINIATNTVIQYVTAGINPFSQPFHIGFIGTSKAYISNVGGASAQAVSIVDYATDTVTGYVNPNGFPFVVAENILIGSTQAYIENNFNSLVSVVDIASDMVLEYYPYLTFDDPDSAHLNFAGTLLYVANRGSNIINVIDVVTTLPVTTVNTSAFPLNGPVSIDMSPFITPPPPPPLPPAPTNAKGVKCKDHYAMQTDLVDIITWDPPLSSQIVVAYFIYRDATLTDLADIVPLCAPLEFIDHNLRKGQTYNYFIVALYADGSVSGPAIVSVIW